MAQKIYLEDVPLDSALEKFEQALEIAGLLDPFPSERVAIGDARNRITAEPVWAKISAPHYNACAMDGYALRAKDTEGATETNPVICTIIEPGSEPNKIDRAAAAVDTGQALPSWADTVVMIEHTQLITDGSGMPKIELRASLPPWRNVRQMGEDMVATELVLPANHRLRAVDLGAVAGSGNSSVAVYRKPRVAIIPTGSELVSIDGLDLSGISPGQIIEYNSIVLAAQVEQWGGIAQRWPIVPDNFRAIQDAVSEAAIDNDLILINAGSSAGRKDFTADVVSSLGDLLVHGVAVRPGHPVILGLIRRDRQSPTSEERDRSGNTSKDFEQRGTLLSTGDAVMDEQGDSLPGTRGEDTGLSTSHQPAVNLENEGQDLSNQPISEVSYIPIIGVPGYPVSAALTGEIFVQPLLARWLGQHMPNIQMLEATITRKVMSHTGDDDYVRVAVGKVGDHYMATPISRGAGVITSLVRADGIVRIPRFSEGLNAGSRVGVQLYRTPAEIERTIVAIGSHDLTLDLLSQYLAARGQGRRLSSANVGSLGGIMALGRGEAHLAGSHLLDPDTGVYNERFVKKYLPGQDMFLVTLVEREQGWIVPKGNPQHITQWEDITGGEVRIINRQRGAGTRILLDYELEKRGIPAAEVKGYDVEAYTHLAVAAAVASGMADTGLGIAAAARALHLDFIPLANEQYELIIPREFYQSELLEPLLNLLFDREFMDAVEAMPGYDISQMGSVRTISA